MTFSNKNFFVILLQTSAIENLSFPMLEANVFMTCIVEVDGYCFRLESVSCLSVTKTKGVLVETSQAGFLKWMEMTI